MEESDGREAGGRGASPWLTAAQAARYLGVATGTIRLWTGRGGLACARRGRVVRYRREELDRWLTSGGRDSRDVGRREP